MTHMSAEVAIRELQQHASDVVRRAAAGEHLTITVRGRPVATLSPLQRGSLAQLVESGAARPAQEHPWDLPLPNTAGGFPLSQTLAEAREDER
jgi:prevent-host-death family protein